MFTLEDLSDPAPPPGPLDWNDEGVVILPSFMPASLIGAYWHNWAEDNGFQSLLAIEGEPGVRRLDAANPRGYDETAYIRHPALLALCTYGPLADELERLLGEPAGVHLSLSGWVTTERNWHQDTYLNPPHVENYYAAVWIALGDVHPDSGPFQYVSGSHRWHKLTRDKIGKVVDLSDPMWLTYSEDVLTPLVGVEIKERDAELVTYLPRRGDVLIWHSQLYHRGSKARVPGAYRPALIAHFSGVDHRQDMPPAVQAAGGGWYFPLEPVDLAHAATAR